MLIPRKISPSELANALKVCEERGDITPDLATRLSLFFDSSVDFWLNIQRSYDRELVELKKRNQALSKRIKKTE